MPWPGSSGRSSKRSRPTPRRRTTNMRRLRTRQQGSVFLRRERQADGTMKVSDRWSIKFRRSDGRQVVQVIGPRKREAVERLAEILAAMRAGHAVEKDIRFADYAAQWLTRR